MMGRKHFAILAFALLVFGLALAYIDIKAQDYREFYIALFGIVCNLGVLIALAFGINPNDE
jgi:hypothetical protein